MKKFLRIFSIIILILLIGNTSFAKTGKVNVDSLRVRKEANTTSDIITVIYLNDKVDIVGDSGEWYEITIDNGSGFVKKEFIDDVLDETTSTSTKENNATGAVPDNTSTQNNTQVSTVAPESFDVTNTLYLRVSPSLISQKNVEVKAGTKLQKITEISNWLEVSNGVETGWITRERLANQATVLKNNVEVVKENKQEESKVESTTTNTTSEETKNANNSGNEVNTDTNTTEETKTAERQSDKVGIVVVNTALVREGPSKDNESIDSLNKDDKVNIIGEEGDWYKITFGSISGYVNKSLIKENTVTSRSLTEERTATEEVKKEEVVPAIEAKEVEIPIINATAVTTGTKVVDFARQFLGYRYVYAGKSPETGFDCSGFTKYVFSNFGITLGATTGSQSTVGIEVARSNMVAGDLIIFYDSGMSCVGHVGIYIGDGNFIHAANPSRGVVIDNLNTSTYYNQRFISARRLV